MNEPVHHLQLHSTAQHIGHLERNRSVGTFSVGSIVGVCIVGVCIVAVGVLPPRQLRFRQDPLWPPGTALVGSLRGVFQQPLHVGLQLYLVKQGRLGLVPQRREIVYRQHRSRGLFLDICICIGIGIDFCIDFCIDIDIDGPGVVRSRRLVGLGPLLLEFVSRQGVPGKKSLQLRVSALQHGYHLLVRPVVHRDAADLRHGHTQAPVLAGAVDADQGAVGNGRPLRVARVAIDAVAVSLQLVQEGSAGHGEFFAVDVVVVVAVVAAVVGAAAVVERAAFRHLGQFQVCQIGNAPFDGSVCVRVRVRVCVCVFVRVFVFVPVRIRFVRVRRVSDGTRSRNPGVIIALGMSQSGCHCVVQYSYSYSCS